MGSSFSWFDASVSRSASERPLFAEFGVRFGLSCDASPHMDEPMGRATRTRFVTGRSRVVALRPSHGRASRMPIDLAHLSDEALVALVARSDEVALAELYDRWGRVSYGLALRILRDEGLAEDAVQEAFLAVWRSAARFVPERAKASTWILTLVHRRAGVDLVRRSERRRWRSRSRTSRSRRIRRPRPKRSPGSTSNASGSRRPEATSRPAARGTRARLLRRLHAVGAGREARTASRYHQEQDVRRPQPPGDLLQETGTEDHRWNPTESTS